MRVSRVLVVVAVLMAVTTASQAQVRALGPGVGVSCNVWLEARSDPEGPLVFGLLSWVLGYITGAAVYGSVGDVLRVHPGSYCGLTKLSHHQPDRRPT